MPFSPEYVRYVLHEHFEDAKALLLEPMVAIDYAHLVMLVEQEIVSPETGRRIREAPDRLSADSLRAARYDAGCEDLFFYREQRLVALVGEEASGRLHTARSRNDIDMTMYRMRQREFVLGLLRASLELRGALLAIAEEHRETVFPAHTHTQPAQPTTLAHYLLAVVEQLERDGRRLKSAFTTVNRCPLGACAITGTGFPIDRWTTSRLLGFDSPTVNTYGSIAAADYLLECVSAAATLLVGLGRFVQDLLLWCTAEVGYLRLSEGFVQRSSIMPQKRNPVAIEHARALGSKALGEAIGIVTVLHNTPFGDIVDSEDDLQPLVFAAFKDATRATALVAAAMRDAAFDAAKMGERAAHGWITVTELADTMVRDHDVPFRTGHAIASGFVRLKEREPGMPLSVALARAAQEVMGSPLAYTDAQLADILSPAHFVKVRRTLGGPAPSETRLAIDEARARSDDDQRWLEERVAKLTAAQRELGERVAQM
jgi:argininosuccinate lyase